MLPLAGEGHLPLVARRALQSTPAAPPPHRDGGEEASMHSQGRLAPNAPPIVLYLIFVIYIFTKLPQKQHLFVLVNKSHWLESESGLSGFRLLLWK